jgi:UDP-N-acetylmuramoylalanine--D-glutamate ligase
MEAKLPIKGSHNLENALAAVAAASLAGVDKEAIRDAVQTFRPVEHRLEFVRTLDGVDYYNDSKATNVDAAAKSIEAFDGNLWVILGGSDKGADFTALRNPLAARARAALLIGHSAAKLGQQLEGAVPCHDVGTLEKALQFARREARPGDTVLLAPACASFDQFSNYGHRGRVFKEVAGLLE